MGKVDQLLVSFFIVNYNGGNLIKACLNSIEEFAGIPYYEVIVVDNNSTDQSADRLEKEFPKITVIRNEKNVGFARAMNQAFKLSKGKYVFSFNPDAELMEGCIPQLVDYMESHPRVGKVGTAAIESNGNLSLPVTVFPKWITPQLVKVFRSRFSSQKPDTLPLNASGIQENQSWLFGTGILIRRESLGPDGLMYPEKSFLFWEEYWLSKRLKENGYSITVLPNAQIIHHSGATFKTKKNRLKMARVLSLSHEYLIRIDEYGKFNALTNAFITFADYALLFFVFAPRLLWRTKDIDLYNTVIDYYAKSRAGFIILTKCKSEILKIDQRAEVFFNQ